ncbi:MAG: flagella basal body P-ring formation protein FlgA, partial [Yoonia sp.]
AIILLLSLPPFLMCGGAESSHAPTDSATYFLLQQVEVDSEGVYLDEVIRPQVGIKIPHLKIAGAPQFGETGSLTRMRLNSILKDQAPDLLPDAWDGVDAIRITRKFRTLGQDELQAMISTRLQAEYIEDDGRLELEFSRPWKTVTIPDEEITMTIGPLPTSGIASYLIVRIGLETVSSRLGSWQVPVRAQIWRDTWVAARRLKRGESLSLSDLRKEPLDVLRYRNGFELPADNAPVELMSDVGKGTPLTERHVRLRPLVKRRQVVDAFYRSGSISIIMKVEVMEEGVGGQIIRVRNIISRRILNARVLGEGSVTIVLSAL